MNFLREQVDDIDKETAESGQDLEHVTCINSSSDSSKESSLPDECSPLLTKSMTTNPETITSNTNMSEMPLHQSALPLSRLISDNALTHTSDLRDEITVWKKAENALGDTKDAKTVRRVLQSKVVQLETVLRKRLKEKPPNKTAFDENLLSLQKKYRIRNKPLLIKTGIVMVIVILLFFLQSLPSLNLSLGWISILGAVCLLALADMEDMEAVFDKVEWPTLVFFACLFVVMEALGELRLLEWIGEIAQNAIEHFSPGNSRLFMGINIILWISAISSAFIDNIPFATAVVKVLENMSKTQSLDIQITPLVYALAFGACFGGIIIPLM